MGLGGPALLPHKDPSTYASTECPCFEYKHPRNEVTCKQKEGKRKKNKGSENFLPSPPINTGSIFGFLYPCPPNRDCIVCLPIPLPI